MKTECKPEQIEFHSLGRRDVVEQFDGGTLLREIEN